MTAKVRVLTEDNAEHIIDARIIERYTFAGVEMVRWEPTERLSGALAFYNGWKRGALVLPAHRVVA